MSHKLSLGRAGAHADHLSGRLNRWVERVCALLAAILVIDVWLGIVVRYVLPLDGLTFTEEAARYLMIWMALLAVSCGIVRREHVGVLLLFDALPDRVRHWLLLVLDLIGLAFFAFLFAYGIGFARSGFSQLTMIYEMPLAIPFAAVPVSCGLAAIQIVLVAVRDQARLRVEPGRASL